MTVPTKKTRLFTRRDVNRDDFVDLLTQRWIAERAAVTLYQLAAKRLEGEEGLAALPPELHRFRLQEEAHAEMLEQLLGELGHTPRHERATSSVNIAASAMSALLEALRGERIGPMQVLEVLHMAERLDRSGWELLTDLAKEAELDEDYLRSFRAAGREEAEHEHVVHAHLMRMERELLVGAGPSGAVP